MNTDPLGNNEGTIRGILAIIFAITMCIMAAVAYYAHVVLGKPDIGLDAFTGSIVTLGTSIIGLYLGLRTKQGDTQTSTATMTATVTTPKITQVPVVEMPDPKDFVAVVPNEHEELQPSLPADPSALNNAPEALQHIAAS